MAVDLSDALARKKRQNPQRTDLWCARLPNLTETLGRGQGIPAMDKARSDLRSIIGGRGGNSFSMMDINHRISSINIPFFTTEVEQSIENNSYWHYPKRHEVSEVTVEIDEFEDAQTLRYLHTWQKMMVKDDGTYFPPAIYKMPFKVYRLPSTKNTSILTHTYHDCFISAITEITSDYESTEIMKYNITLTCDGVSTQFHDIEGRVNLKEKEILKQRIHFKGDDPANLREFVGGEVVSDSYDVLQNVVERVPGI